MRVVTSDIINNIKFFEKVTSNNISIYLFAIAIYIASTLLWALRWYLILERLGSRVSFQNVYTAIMGGILFNNITPSLKFGGEGFRAGWLRLTEGIPTERSLVTIMYERITEIPGILSVVLAALLPGTSNISILSLNLLIINSYYLSLNLRNKIILIKKRLGEDVNMLLRDWTLTLISSSIAVLIWLQDIIRFYLIAASLSVHITLNEAAVLSLGYLIFGMGPTPGGIGFVEGGLISILVTMGIPADKASLIVLGERLISTVLASILGIILVLLRGGIKLFREVSKIVKEERQ